MFLTIIERVVHVYYLECLQIHNSLLTYIIKQEKEEIRAFVGIGGNTDYEVDDYDQYLLSCFGGLLCSKLNLNLFVIPTKLFWEDFTF